MEDKSTAMFNQMPKYVTVRDHLRRRILTMELGEKLPAEPQLCDEYHVSRITLRHAVDDLIQEGLLIREQGRGTFRADANQNSDESEVISGSIVGYYRQQKDLGSTVTSKVLGNSVVIKADMARKLQLHDDDKLIRLERLRMVNGHPTQYVITYLSAQRFTKVLDHDFSTGSLYEFLEDNYAVRLIRNEIAIHIESLNARIAWMLDAHEDQSVLAMESLVYDEFGSPIAMNVSLYPQDESEIKFVITADKSAA